MPHVHSDQSPAQMQNRAPQQREKLEGGKAFVMQTEFQPAGDQPTAIAELSAGVRGGDRDQVLLGATGTGKTFTMAKVIEETQRPAIILAPNKTLAAQLYGEFKGFFPRQRGRVFRQLLRLLPARSLCRRGPTPISRKKARSTNRSTGCATRPPARFAGTRRCDHRGLGVVHLWHRLGRNLFGHDAGPDRRQGIRPAPGDGRPCGAAIPPQRSGVSARQLPGARRQPWKSGPPTWRTAPGGCRFFGEELEGDHRVRPPDRLQNRQF